METLARQAESVLNQNYFDHYVKFTHNGQYEHFRHTKLVCKYLQRIADGEQLALMIEMPPRHGKSMTVTESFPSFYLGKNPEKRVITASYSDSLAKKFGRKNKDKFKEFAGPLNNLELSKTNAAVKDWGIEGHSGGMLSTGVGGSITGHGADLMIIDDPIKNQQDASSETIREKIWDEWESTLSTRLHGGASVIVVMTRWHEDDIIGRLLKQGARPWIRLRLPAVAEDETDLLHRKIGEVLCPELGYDEKWAKQKQKEVGSRTWSSLYQQRPTPAGGSIFKRKWVKYYVPSREVKDRLNLSDETIILTWDYLAGAARMPKTVLKGQEAGTLTGAQYDVMNYYSRIASMQENSMRPQLEYLVRLLMWCEDECGGRIDPDSIEWSIEFNPLWSVDSKTDAEIRKLTAESDKIYIESGVLDPSDVQEARFGRFGVTETSKFNADSATDIDKLAESVYKKYKENRADG